MRRSTSAVAMFYIGDDWIEDQVKNGNGPRRPNQGTCCHVPKTLRTQKGVCFSVNNA